MENWVLELARLQTVAKKLFTFYDEINLILNPAGRNFMTQMTLMCTVVFIRIRYYCVEFTPSGNRYGYKTVYIRVSKVVVYHKKLLTQWRYMYINE